MRHDNHPDGRMKAGDPPRRPPARRLKQTERRAALLQAARELALEQGVAMPSLDAIIARAGGSRRSIYTEFGGKAGLQAALIGEISADILAALPDPTRTGNEPRDLRAVLKRFAHALLATLTSAHGTDSSRIIIQDSLISPERARAFFAHGPGEGEKRLTTLLEAARARGEIVLADCHIAARCFIGMVRGNLYLERMLQLRPPPCEEEIRTHVETAVEIFMAGVERRFVLPP
jgi:AcrR family transcriptional regulator